MPQRNSIIFLGAVILTSILSSTSRAQDCVPIPAGAVAWWPGNNSIEDNYGRLPASMEGALSYAAGQVGLGFQFPGGTPGLRVPANGALDVGQSSGFTLELWINPVSGSTPQPLFEWTQGAGFGVHFWISSRLYANVVDTSGYGHIIESSGVTVESGVFQHLALTYDSSTGRARLYYNGTLAAEEPIGSITPATASDLMIGFRATGLPDGPAYFQGIIDEPTVYSRELDSTEIASIYSAGIGGKCNEPLPASFAELPSSSYVGWVEGSLTMTSLGVGTPPLIYQWYHENKPISGASSSSLHFPVLSLDMAGAYTLMVSNEFGSAFADTYLTVKTVPTCTAPPNGLISLWRGDYDSNDSVGQNHGSFGKGQFSEGLVRACFSFNGIQDAVEVPDTATLNPSSAITLECWANPAEVGVTNLTILSKGTGNNGPEYAFTMIQQDGQSFFRAMLRTDTSIQLTSTNAVTAGIWHHLALTYDGQEAVFFVNGEAASKVKRTGSVTADPFPFHIGRDLSGNFWKGLIDEVALYGKALSAQQVLEQFKSGAGGKCKTAVPPFILVQPTSTTVFPGKQLKAQVVAAGSAPLAYQWLKDGVAVNDATNASFQRIFDVPDTGSYAVVVSNSAGHVTSIPVSFVASGPPSLSMKSATAVTGSTFDFPVSLITYGSEIVCSFSIQLDINRLQFSGAALNSPNGAVVMVNTAASAAGRIGFAVVAPGDGTLGYTTNVIRLSLTAGGTSGSATVAFIDSPLQRQTIYSDFKTGTVSSTTTTTVQLLPGELEADVLPAVPDRALTTSDWLRVGRYVAGLETPATGPSFQRTDCAPRSSKGDGQLDVADWIQSYRYVFGHDPATNLGGPTQGVPPVVSTETNRQVRVRGIRIEPFAEADLPVTMQATGDENAIGFSLGFDSGAVRFVSAQLGNATAGSYSLLNTNGLARGELGVAIALPANTKLPPGESQIFVIKFKNVQTNTIVLQPQFRSAPIVAQASSWEALPLPVMKVSLPAPSVTPPQLHIERLSNALQLTWPSSASGYVLQEASDVSDPLQWSNSPQSPELLETSYRLALPQHTTNNIRYFRLHTR